MECYLQYEETKLSDMINLFSKSTLPEIVITGRIARKKEISVNAIYIFDFSLIWLIASFIGAVFDALRNFIQTSIFTWKSR